MASLFDLSKEELVAIILDLRKRLEALEVEVAQLRKNSSNSSKPPSSDIVKPPKPPAPSGRRKRRVGGRPGHPRHDRAAFAPDEINRTRIYELHRCPGCGGRLQRLADGDRIIQQVEMVRAPVTVSEHRAHSYRCTHCGRTHDAPMPAPVVKCGLIGPNLTAIVAYLKGVCHASFSTIRKFLRDVIRVTVSRGQLAKLKVGRNAPMRRDAQNLAERFRKHGDAYFQFITTPGLEPTNNLAEQAIRFVVIDRRITQDTRSVTGRQWNERIWTMIATLTQQGRSILAYLRDALHSNLNNWPAPALPPAGP